MPTIGRQARRPAGSTLDRFGRRQQRLCLVPALDDFVDDAEVLGLVGGHEVIAVERLIYYFVALLGMLHVDLVEATFHLDDVLGMALDVARLPGEPAGGLV